MVFENTSSFETWKQFPKQYQTQMKEKQQQYQRRSRDFLKYMTRNLKEEEITVNQRWAAIKNWLKNYAAVTTT